MNWKSWPYWIKGGIITSVYALIAVIITFLFFTPQPGDNGSMLMIFLFPFFVIWTPLNFLVLLLSPLLKLFHPFIGTLIVSVIYTFPIGAIIGWLYGKIKTRDKPPTEAL